MSHIAELVSSVPSPCCFLPGHPFQQSLALSACVSPPTIHFRVLKSPLSGPGRGSPFLQQFSQSGMFFSQVFMTISSSLTILFKPHFLSEAHLNNPVEQGEPPSPNHHPALLFLQSVLLTIFLLTTKRPNCVLYLYFPNKNEEPIKGVIFAEVSQTR